MEVNGYNFEYLETGHGDPMVFVHGSVSDYRTWTVQMNVFGRKYRAIAYSRRFHWPNEKISEQEDYAMKQHVSDLGAILRGIGRPVHLVGHSYGAFICLLLAMKSSHFIRTMVLEEPPVVTLYVSHHPKPLEILKLFATKPKTAMALVKLGAKGLEPAAKAMEEDQQEKAIEVLGKAILGDKAFSNLSQSRLEQVYQNMIKAELTGSGFPRLQENKISEIETPTLLIGGEHSPPIFQLLLDRLMQLMQNAQKKVVEGASHISHEDNPIAYNKMVLAFIEECG